MNDADKRAFMIQHANTLAWLDNASEQAKANGLISADQVDPPEFLLMREPLPPRVPDLCPDDEYRAACAAKIKTAPFFPDGAIYAIMEAHHRAGLQRPKSVRVEWSAEYAMVVAYVPPLSREETDLVMAHAIKLFPEHIAVDIRTEVKP